MAQSSIFREQHGQLLQAVKEISRLLSAEELTSNAKPVRSLLSKMAGLVRVHLAMEDQVLYPTLRKHPDPQVRHTAERFVQEMGGISAAFTQYLKRWPTSASISSDPASFIRETNALFQTLGNRIARENEELYPLIEVEPVARVPAP